MRIGPCLLPDLQKTARKLANRVQEIVVNSDRTTTAAFPKHTECALPGAYPFYNLSLYPYRTCQTAAPHLHCTKQQLMHVATWPISYPGSHYEKSTFTELQTSSPQSLHPNACVKMGAQSLSSSLYFQQSFDTALQVTVSAVEKQRPAAGTLHSHEETLALKNHFKVNMYCTWSL